MKLQLISRVRGPFFRSLYLHFRKDTVPVLKQWAAKWISTSRGKAICFSEAMTIILKMLQRIWILEGLRDNEIPSNFYQWYFVKLNAYIWVSGIKWKTLYMKKRRALALAKNIERGNSPVISENPHPWFLHSKFQTFCDESYPETVKISLYNLKRPFKMENTEVIWWSILFSNAGFGICCLSLKLFCVREVITAEHTRSVSPGFRMSNQLPLWGRII